MTTERRIKRCELRVFAWAWITAALAIGSVLAFIAMFVFAYFSILSGTVGSLLATFGFWLGAQRALAISVYWDDRLRDELFDETNIPT